MLRCIELHPTGNTEGEMNEVSRTAQVRRPPLAPAYRSTHQTRVLGLACTQRLPTGCMMLQLGRRLALTPPHIITRCQPCDAHAATPTMARQVPPHRHTGPACKQSRSPQVQSICPGLYDALRVCATPLFAAPCALPLSVMLAVPVPCHSQKTQGPPDKEKGAPRGALSRGE